MTPSVNILAERERHLLSNHADIEATKNNAIEHFLYVESFRDEQKICLNLVRRGHDVFAILPTGSGRESLIFLTLFPFLIYTHFAVGGKGAQNAYFHLSTVQNPHIF